MTKLINPVSVCLLLILTFGWQQVSSKKALMKYGIEDAIDDISPFIPGSRIILRTAVKLWLVYGELQSIASANGTDIKDALDQMDEKLDVMSLKLESISEHLDKLDRNVKEIKDIILDKVILELPDQIHLDSLKATFYKDIEHISKLFKDFRSYENFDLGFTNETILSFIGDILKPITSKDSLSNLIEEIHTKFVNSPGNEEKSMIRLMADPGLYELMICKRPPGSAQQRIILAHNDIMKAEIKALTMYQFAINIKQLFHNGTTPIHFKAELEKFKNDYFERSASTALEVKKNMLVAPRDYWKCDPRGRTAVEGSDYEKLGPIFQAYIMSEKDSDTKDYLGQFTDKCDASCQQRSDTKDICRSRYCSQKHKNPCKGTMRNCQAAAAVADKKMKICLAKKGSTKRYEYVQLMNKGTIYGKQKPCDRANEHIVRDKLNIYRDCEMCFCTCEVDDADMARYFSLREVTSDAGNNKVVTGVRLVKKNNIFHFQIEEGILEENGNIKKNSAEWKQVENYTIHDANVTLGIDYHKITWDDRGVHLDELDALPKHALTGLKFNLDNDDKFLRLSIQVTPFDFTTGELITSRSQWLYNPDDAVDRTELILSNPRLPISSQINKPDSTKNSNYVKFTTSALPDDVGQTVVPFIDVQKIRFRTPVPLSGAGLIHRGDSDSAGYLSLKVFTYDYAPHLEI